MTEKHDPNQPYFAPAVSDEAPVLASAQVQEDMRQIASHIESQDAGGIFGAGIFDGSQSGILKKLAELEARVEALEERVGL
jgi:hypothetical protein